MFFAVRLTLNQSLPPVKNATHLRTFCFLEFISAFRPIYFWFIFVFLSTSMFFWLLDLHWDSPKLPWGMQWICGHSDLKTILKNHYAFRETLRPVPLAHWIFVFYSSLYYYTSDTFRPFLSLFTYFASHQFFHITTRNIFLIPDYPLIGESSEFNFYFNFSSPSAHLNYILLSNVYSFEFP